MKDFIQLEQTFGAHNYHPLPVVLARGEGVFVWDVHDKQYLDFLSAYGAVNQGHVHPKILNSLIRQANNLTLSSRAFYNNQLGLLEEMLCQKFGFEKALLMNTGVEAGESAIKLARKWAYEIKGIESNKAEIIFAKNNFWGRTISAVSSSTDPESYTNFGPFTPGFQLVNYNDLEALEKALQNKHVAAFMVEPIQGEAGIILPDKGYLKGVRALCDQYRVLFIADEIQSGLGRTGKWMACEHDSVKPDIVLLGKALSGGFLPVSAVLSSNEVMDRFRPGQHGSTYGGNPLAAAVAMTALQVLEEENMLENAEKMGEILLSGLREIQARHSIIREVRGIGLFCALELDTPEDSSLAWDLCLKWMEKGLLAKPTHGNKIRLAPPLVIQKQEIEQALSIIDSNLS